VNELIEATNFECAQRLRKFIADGRDVAYFIGSGLSQPTYPNWRALVSRVRDFFRANAPDAPPVAIPSPEEIDALLPSDLQEIFQRFRDLDPRIYVDCVKDIFETPPVTQNRCLTKILKTRPTLIATINFDVAIEAAASDCDIKVDMRFFPTMRYVMQDEENVPVVMHLHGKFHEQLYEDPDRLILHTSGYRRWYHEGDQVIKHILSDIFLGHDVVFLGTSLSEPEMASFFKAFQNHRRTSNNRRRRITLLGTKAKRDLTDNDKCRRVLREEQSRDSTEGTETGIERIRFFSKGDDYLGLHEVLSEAFGQRTVAPEPKPIWGDAI